VTRTVSPVPGGMGVTTEAGIRALSARVPSRHIWLSCGSPCRLINVLAGSGTRSSAVRYGESSTA